MNSWTQNQNQNMNINMNNSQTSFPTNMWGQYTQRLPVYQAAPIHGQNAAWQFPMGPNSEIYLPDADQDIIWWIRTDNNGNKNVQAFDVKLHQEPKPIDTNDLAARLAAVEEWIYAKSNKPNAKRNNNAGVDANQNASATPAQQH